LNCNGWSSVDASAEAAGNGLAATPFPGAAPCLLIG